MIKKETVIILGAGASKPYGFPTGDELTNKIVKLFSKQHNLDNMEHAIMNSGSKIVNISKMNAREIAEKLGGTPWTIDKWLSVNKDFTNIGKLAINYLILQYEYMSTNTLENRDQENSWYVALLNEMSNSADFRCIDDLLNNKVTFVTWNYDRSLEEYLYRFLNKSFTKDGNDKCNEIAKNINIIHLHGKVGSLLWQQEKDSYSIEYGVNASWINAFKCIDSINIVGEKEVNDSNYNLAKQAMQKASNIFFLGCGFWNENMERLKIDNCQDKEFAATCIGLADKVTNDYKKGYNVFKRPFVFYGGSISDFITKHVKFE